MNNDTTAAGGTAHSGRPDGDHPEPARRSSDAPGRAAAGTPARKASAASLVAAYRRTGSRDGNAAFASITGTNYALLIAVFIGVMMISNITGTKGVLLFPGLHVHLGFLKLDGLVTDGAFYLFPLAYVLGDVISEVYGFRAMRRAVFAGFGILILAALCFTLTVHLPAADFYTGQKSFETVAGVVPRFLIAGLSGYVVGELLNSLVLVSMKRRSGERALWARLLGSTVVGEFVDTLTFCTIAAPALGMTIGGGDYWNYTVIGFVWKTLVELLIMPISYAVIAVLKRREPSYQEALARLGE